MSRTKGDKIRDARLDRLIKRDVLYHLIAQDSCEQAPDAYLASATNIPLLFSWLSINFKQLCDDGILVDSACNWFYVVDESATIALCSKRDNHWQRLGKDKNKGSDQLDNWIRVIEWEWTEGDWRRPNTLDYHNDYWQVYPEDSQIKIIEHNYPNLDKAQVFLLEEK